MRFHVKIWRTRFFYYYIIIAFLNFSYFPSSFVLVNDISIIEIRLFFIILDGKMLFICSANEGWLAIWGSLHYSLGITLADSAAIVLVVKLLLACCGFRLFIKFDNSIRSIIILLDIRYFQVKLLRCWLAAAVLWSGRNNLWIISLGGQLFESAFYWWSCLYSRRCSSCCYYLWQFFTDQIRKNLVTRPRTLKYLWGWCHQ